MILLCARNDPINHLHLLCLNRSITLPFRKIFQENILQLSNLISEESSLTVYTHIVECGFYRRLKVMVSAGRKDIFWVLSLHSRSTTHINKREITMPDESSPVIIRWWFYALHRQDVAHFSLSLHCVILFDRMQRCYYDCIRFLKRFFRGHCDSCMRSIFYASQNISKEFNLMAATSFSYLISSHYVYFAVSRLHF